MRLVYSLAAHPSMAFLIDDDAVSLGEQLHHPCQRYRRYRSRDSRWVNLVKQHHGPIAVDLDAQLVFEIVEVLTVVVRDLFERDAHLLGEALSLALRQTGAIQCSSVGPDQPPEILWFMSSIV